MDIVTIGSGVRDFSLYIDRGKVIKNPKDPIHPKLVSFDFGSKINVSQAYFNLGGCGCNTAIVLTKLGLEVASIVRVGEDRDGTAIIEELRSHGIDTRLIQIDNQAPTGFSFIMNLFKEKDRTIFVYRGANNNLKVSKSELIKAGAKWFYLGSITGPNWREVLDKVFSAAKARSIQIAWNPGGTQLKAGRKALNKYIRRTTVLLLNEEEAKELVLGQGLRKKVTPQFLLKELYRAGSKIVVNTYGRKGAYVYDGQKVYFQPALSKKIVDTTGAGDTFGATFVGGLIIFQGNIKKALKMAALNSAAVLTKVGAQHGLLTKRELLKKIELR